MNRALYVMELVVTAALLVLILVLWVAVSWWAAAGAFVAFLFGMMFAIVSNVRRAVRIDIKERAAG